MDWSFGEFLWAMLAFFFWAALIWMFIAVFADIIRRPQSGWARAGWIALIVLMPCLGVLIYLIARPPADDRGNELIAWGPSTRQVPREYRPADEITKAARLHDEGRISSDEFEHIKRQVLIR